MLKFLNSKKRNLSSKSKLSSKRKLTKKNKSHKTHRVNKSRVVDKYCGIYKKDINGKTNKDLYKDCKTNKYCRKYKCKNIDLKLIKKQTKKFGENYNNVLFEHIKEYCPPNLLFKDRKKCQNNALEKFYDKHNMKKLYDKKKECDYFICAKERRAFIKHLFRYNKVKLNVEQKKMINFKLEDEVDKEAIERGD
jgi:hypothetical protein